MCPSGEKTASRKQVGDQHVGVAGGLRVANRAIDIGGIGELTVGLLEVVSGPFPHTIERLRLSDGLGQQECVGLTFADRVATLVEANHAARWGDVGAQECPSITLSACARPPTSVRGSASGTR